MDTYALTDCQEYNRAVCNGEVHEYHLPSGKTIVCCKRHEPANSQNPDGSWPAQSGNIVAGPRTDRGGGSPDLV